jgi:L-histidine N-alpha-methyltransferase
MSITVQSHLVGTERAQALAEDVRTGLGSTPKSLPPKWFYDERGSALFDEITRLPEYYPTNAERAVLRERAAEIVAVSGADTLVELGSGTSEKTRLLLDAFAAAGRLERFVPFDVDASILQQAGDAVAAEYPGTQVRAVAGDFERHLDRLPVAGRRLVVFLGSTIGNLEPQPRARFLAAVVAGLRPGDAFLLGTDLVKDTTRLVAAYDDSAGVTAQFNKNVLRVVNRELDADFDLDAFEHVARWDEPDEWIEMHLRSARSQTVTVGALDLTVQFERGELMRTEVSAKFRQSGVRRELAAAGLATLRWWTDPDGDFGVSLSALR